MWRGQSPEVKCHHQIRDLSSQPMHVYSISENLHGIPLYLFDISTRKEVLISLLVKKPPLLVGESSH